MSIQDKVQQSLVQVDNETPIDAIRRTMDVLAEFCYDNDVVMDCSFLIAEKSTNLSGYRYYNAPAYPYTIIMEHVTQLMGIQQMTEFATYLEEIHKSSGRTVAPLIDSYQGSTYTGTNKATPIAEEEVPGLIQELEQYLNDLKYRDEKNRDNRIETEDELEYIITEVMRTISNYAAEYKIIAMMYVSYERDNILSHLFSTNEVSNPVSTIGHLVYNLPAVEQRALAGAMSAALLDVFKFLDTLKFLSDLDSDQD